MTVDGILSNAFSTLLLGCVGVKKTSLLHPCENGRKITGIKMFSMWGGHGHPWPPGSSAPVKFMAWKWLEWISIHTKTTIRYDIALSWWYGYFDVWDIAFPLLLHQCSVLDDNATTCAVQSCPPCDSLSNQDKVIYAQSKLPLCNIVAHVYSQLSALLQPKHQKVQPSE